MSAILGIDPGPVRTGWCWYETGTVLESGVWANHDILGIIDDPLPIIAIERFEARGMAIADESIETVLWTGRYIQATARPDDVRLIRRRDVKLHLCGTARAKDANVRQALIDLLGAPGRKASPGPTYGVAGDAWAALGVAVTAHALEPTQEGPFKAPRRAVDARESETGRVG